MRRLTRPPFTVSTVYQSCISTVNNALLKRKLNNCMAEIISDEALFEQLATNAELFNFPEKVTVNGNVTTKEMKTVYTYRMVDGPGRPYYDALLQMPKHGVCPFCGHRTVATLDHHLPKSKHPTLVVTPLNLIPSCTDCNQSKRDFMPSSPDEEPIHPYFDDMETERWLYANVVAQNPGIVIKYEVRTPANWDSVKTRRVENHFLNLHLAHLYTLQAAVELSERKHRLMELHEQAGPSAVQDFLEETAADFTRVYTNSWKTAMYDALASETWFHNQGLFEIG